MMSLNSDVRSSAATCFTDPEEVTLWHKIFIHYLTVKPNEEALKSQREKKQH